MKYSSDQIIAGNGTSAENLSSRILNSALTLFASRSYRTATLRQIAELSGITYDELKTQFSSKQKILEAIIIEGSAINREIENETGEIADPLGWLSSIITRSFDHIKQNENYWRFYVSVILQPEVMNIARKINLPFNRDMYLRLEDTFRQLGYENPARELALLDAALDGISLHYFFDREHYPLDEVKEALLQKYARSMK